jgi:NADH-quinone oxidoreductase subunit H
MVLFVPHAGALVFFAGSVSLVCAVTAVAALTARLTLARAFRFYWVWGGVAAAASMTAALIG